MPLSILQKVSTSLDVGLQDAEEVKHPIYSLIPIIDLQIELELILEVSVFLMGGKPENLGRKTFGARREPTTNLTHMRQ